MLFMNTLVCSSACKRYEALIVAITLPYFTVFAVICAGYIPWYQFTYTRKGSSFLVVFCIPSLLVLPWFYLVILQCFCLGFAVAFLSAFSQWFFTIICCGFSALFQ